MEISTLQKVVEAYFEENGHSDCFWVDGKIQGKLVEIYIDRDTSISFDMCKKVSRHLEAMLDETKVFGEEYTLEVSSPGLDRPLKLVRQYQKNIGRDIEVMTSDERIEGKLLQCSATTITVGFETVEKVGNKKVKTAVEKEIAFENIKESKIVINFK